VIKINGKMKSIWRVGLVAIIFSLSFVYKTEAQTETLEGSVVVQEKEACQDISIDNYKHQFDKKKERKRKAFVRTANVCAVDGNYKQQVGKRGIMRPENIVRIETQDFALVDRNYKRQAI
jgi:hypothetical protein